MMKKTVRVSMVFWGLAASILMVGNVLAAEVLMKDVTEKNVKVEEVFEKVTDNIAVLFDASGSMAQPYKDTGMAKVEIAKKLLKDRGALPELGYNAGLYTFTPWETYYEMQPYDEAKVAAAIDQLPTTDLATRATPLGQGIQNLGPILDGVSGKTTVFIFSDGTYTFRPRINPIDAARALDQKHDVTYYLISSAQTDKQRKLLDDIAAINESSRVVSFDTFLANPDYYSGALYVVKTNEITEEITRQKVVGLSVGDIRFDFDKADVRPEYEDDLEALTKFLEEHPNATGLIQGFTDNTGPEEYNLRLSHRRVESVRDYLVQSHNLDPGRLVLQWYGPANPIASNDTPEGRAQNRRVEIDISMPSM
jgi:OOP family OmpA-OmpF porin